MTRPDALPVNPAPSYGLSALKLVIWACGTGALLVAAATLSGPATLAVDRHRLSLSRTLGWDAGTAPTLPGFALELCDLADRLATILAEPACRGAAVLAPAGIGGHLDHVLTALATHALLDAGLLASDRVRFYEDMPYAAAEPATRAESLSRPTATGREALALKLAALAVFRTRLRAPQIALCKARAIALGGDGAPAEMTFAATGAARLAMDSGRAVGSMAS